MATHEDIENVKLQNNDDLCKLVELLGYRRRFGGQLTCSNGAEVSSLLDFLNDNPGAIEAIHEFIVDNIDSYSIDDDEEEKEDNG